MRRIATGLAVAVLAVSGGFFAQAQTTAPVPTATTAKAPGTAASQPASRITIEQTVKMQAAAILDALQNDGDFAAAHTKAQGLFDQVAATAGEKSLDAFREADFALRLVATLEAAKKESRQPLLKYLRTNDGLAHTLVFLLNPGNHPKDVYAMLDKLREKRGEQLDKYATLAAAICVVHDKPFSRQINENSTQSADPIDIFDYYVKNESVMNFGIKQVPAELLIYVVDTTASIDEMKWALGKYVHDEIIGRHFFDIAYDYEHFLHATPKKVTEKGFNLPNILKYGGVCADQAYYAMAIGKAIGVPTAYTVGQSAEVGHAWVGFLQAQNGHGFWNFDVGRYEEYRGVKGNVFDPQAKQEIPDSYVSLLAELIGTKPVDRQNCVALTDAALRLKSAENFSPVAWDIEPANLRPAPRRAEAASVLGLLEPALNLNRANPRAWFAVRDLASEGKLSLEQKKKWSEVLLKLCGSKYPDFALSVLGPMIETVDDPADQNTLWNGAFNMFKNRSDLAAEIRMGQAHMWEKHEQKNKAGQCYMDVIERYCNAGPFVLDALSQAEELLSGKADKILSLYEQTWTRIQRPQQMAGPFMKQSNWYKVGRMYAGKLQSAGNTTKAKDILAQIGDATK